jgi:hypothetical protein
MKTSSVLLILGLVGSLELGCKKTVEPAQPKSPADCRIIATVYKIPIEGRNSNVSHDLEGVILSNGRRVTVSRVINAYYKYDEQDRIIEFTEKWPNGDARFTTYRYLPDRVLIYSEQMAPSISPVKRISRDTIGLYSNGLQARYQGVGEAYIRYNAKNQFQADAFINPSDSCRYENGNCVEKLQNVSWYNNRGQWIPTDYSLLTYKYDLAKPNIRPYLQFEGSLSKNLPLSEFRESRASTQFPEGPLYQKTYLYTFDQHGRVSRRIAHGEPLYGGWFIEDDYRGVGVTDYIYECP